MPQDLQAAQLANAAAQAQLDAAQAKASETVGVQDSLVTRAANDVQAARDTLAADEQQAALEHGRVQHGPGRERGGQPVCFRSWLRRHRADHAPAGHRGGTQPGAHELVQPARPPDHPGPGARDRGGGRLRPGGGEAATERGTVGPTLTQAQRQLELALGREPAGTLSATPANLASAEAAVAKDAVDIEQARVALDAAVLVAPTDGVVSSVGGSLGEVAGAEGVRVFGTPQPLPQKDSSGINLFPQAPSSRHNRRTSTAP